MMWNEYTNGEYIRKLEIAIGNLIAEAERTAEVLKNDNYKIRELYADRISSLRREAHEARRVLNRDK